MQIKWSTRTVIFFGLGLGSALGLAIGVSKNIELFGASVTGASRIAGETVQIQLYGGHFIFAQASDKHQFINSEVGWKCKAKRFAWEAPVIKTKQAPDLFILSFNNSNKTECLVSVPEKKQIVIMGEVESLVIDQIRNPVSIKMNNGDVTFRPILNVKHLYDVHLKNGVSDTPVSDLKDTPLDEFKPELVIDVSLTKGDFTVVD